MPSISNFLSFYSWLGRIPNRYSYRKTILFNNSSQGCLSGWTASLTERIGEIRRFYSCHSQYSYSKVSLFIKSFERMISTILIGKVILHHANPPYSLSLPGMHARNYLLKIILTKRRIHIFYSYHCRNESQKAPLEIKVGVFSVLLVRSALRNY